MKTRSEIDNNKTIKIYLSPTETGFSCSINNENSKNMTFDEFEILLWLIERFVFHLQ